MAESHVSSKPAPRRRQCAIPTPRLLDGYGALTNPTQHLAPPRLSSHAVPGARRVSARHPTTYPAATGVGLRLAGGLIMVPIRKRQGGCVHAACRAVARPALVAYLGGRRLQRRRAPLPPLQPR